MQSLIHLACDKVLNAISGVTYNVLIEDLRLYSLVAEALGCNVEVLLAEIMHNVAESIVTRKIRCLIQQSRELGINDY